MATEFENKIPTWENEGEEPTSERKEKGFEPEYKPPAAYFNWFWSLVSKCINELQTKFKSHADNIDNPHGVTAEKIGAVKKDLSNLENGVVPVNKGGTGVIELKDFYARQAYHLVPNNCSNKDFNTLKEAGFYFGYTGMTNAACNEISVLEVIPYSNDWVAQRQTRLSDGKIFYRFFYQGEKWSNWTYIYTEKINGAPRVAYGDYTGNGNYGTNNKNTITVDFAPRLVFIGGEIYFQRRYDKAQHFIENYGGTNYVNLEWGENSISWYGNGEGVQMNTSGKTYSYIIFG